MNPISSQGAALTLQYEPDLFSNDPFFSENLHFIQIISSQAATIASGPLIDNQGALNPYYDTKGPAGLLSSQGIFVFADAPTRPGKDVALNHEWFAELYLVEETAPKQVTVYNGISWGWESKVTKIVATDVCPKNGTVISGLDSGGGGFGDEGLTQGNPILATVAIANGPQFFCDVPDRRWFDLPITYGFEFETLDNSLFTGIVDFPVGDDDLFTVSVGDIVLGEFGPGDSVDFVDLLGTGVERFRITDIDSPFGSNEETFFPIQLDANREFFDFVMTPVSRADVFEFEKQHAVPESPVPPLAVLLLGAVGVSLFGKGSGSSPDENAFPDDNDREAGA